MSVLVDGTAEFAHLSTNEVDSSSTLGKKPSVRLSKRLSKDASSAHTRSHSEEAAVA